MISNIKYINQYYYNLIYYIPCVIFNMFLNKQIRNHNGQIYETIHKCNNFVSLILNTYVSFYIISYEYILSTIESRTIQDNGTIIISTSNTYKICLKI